MIEFFVWKSVLLLPSLMVPPICPGLCSGMSMTWEKHSEQEVRLRDAQSQAHSEILTGKKKSTSIQKTTKQHTEHCLEKVDQQNLIN